MNINSPRAEAGGLCNNRCERSYKCRPIEMRFDLVTRARVLQPDAIHYENQ